MRKRSFPSTWPLQEHTWSAVPWSAAHTGESDKPGSAQASKEKLKGDHTAFIQPSNGGCTEHETRHFRCTHGQDEMQCTPFAKREMKTRS